MKIKFWITVGKDENQFRKEEVINLKEFWEVDEADEAELIEEWKDLNSYEKYEVVEEWMTENMNYGFEESE